MRLVLTRQARRGLQEIGDWIAQDSPRRAVSFVEELEGRLNVLTQAPEGFPLAPGYEVFGVRRYAWRGYLAFYQVIDANVIVFKIVHGARELRDLMFDA
jgi:toxin ParE1/3/4